MKYSKMKKKEERKKETLTVPSPELEKSCSSLLSSKTNRTVYT